MAHHLARLSWQCRRGTQELDLLLTYFLHTCYAQCESAEQTAFQELLQCEDAQLLSFFLGEQQPTSASWCRVVDKIRNARANAYEPQPSP